MTIFDLDKQSVDVACPRCKFYNTVTLKQIRVRDAVICRGCKSTINFEDHMNETRKAIRLVNRAMREMEQQLRAISRITIRL